jgi:tRNA threonylcarbamoyladenosine biosynthesis protein TsaE
MNAARHFDSVILPDATATFDLGARLAASLALGDVVFLMGPLGAGKTTLARALIGAWTRSPEIVPSPTYTLAQVYEGPNGPLWHVDLYRLEGPDDLDELGLEEAYATALTLIEWPERMGGRVPVDRLELRFAMAGEGRRLDMTGFGKWMENPIDRRS